LHNLDRCCVTTQWPSADGYRKKKNPDADVDRYCNRHSFIITWHTQHHRLSQAKQMKRQPTASQPASQTDRQTYRQAGRTDGRTDGETDRETDGLGTQSSSGGRTDRATAAANNRQTGTSPHTHCPSPQQTDRQAPRHTHSVLLHNRQTDRRLATHRPFPPGLTRMTRRRKDRLTARRQSDNQSCG
jgi:hypothetical protein